MRSPNAIRSSLLTKSEPPSVRAEGIENYYFMDVLNSTAGETKLFLILCSRISSRIRARASVSPDSGRMTALNREKSAAVADVPFHLSGTTADRRSYRATKKLFLVDWMRESSKTCCLVPVAEAGNNDTSAELEKLKRRRLGNIVVWHSCCLTNRLINLRA